MTLTTTLHQATISAARALGLPPGATIPPDCLSVIWKFALSASLAAENGGVGEIRRRTREGGCARAEFAAAAALRLSELLVIGCAEGHAEWAEWLEDEFIRRRIIDLALDALFSEPLGPETILSPTPHTLPAQPAHALIFSAFPHCAHEVYPLMVDAYAAGACCQVVGAHADWLDDGMLRRAIVFDVERGLLIEADCQPQARVASAQVLALNLAAEARDHQMIEARLPGVPFTNPYAGARVLDDKAQAAAIWQHASLPTPAFYLFDAGLSPEDLADAITEFGPRVVLKPVDGTEGRGVELISLLDSRLPPSRFALRRTSPYLLMEERGSLRYQGDLRCVARVNVCCNGQHAWAESGYAQVAGNPDGIASAGCGGRIISLRELWQHLHRSDGTSLQPTADDWHRLLALAEAGALALAKALGGTMPALVGLDLLLDAGTDGGIAPVLLEANPRPAGMSHSRFLSPNGPTDEPGVTVRLWKFLCQP